MSTPRGIAYYCAAVLALVSTTLTIVNAATMRTSITWKPHVVVLTCPAEDDPGWDQFRCGDKTGVHIRSRKFANGSDLWP